MKDSTAARADAFFSDTLIVAAARDPVVGIVEEAVTTYGNEVYQWKIRENYLNLEGSLIPTGSFNGSGSYNNQLVTPNLGNIIRISETYASEAGAGGETTWYTGSFTLTSGVQSYNIETALSSSGIDITKGIEIKQIFYEAPPAIVRYFDPYAGTGTGIQSLLETFGSLSNISYICINQIGEGGDLY